jgi:hypothetical protein
VPNRDKNPGDVKWDDIVSLMSDIGLKLPENKNQKMRRSRGQLQVFSPTEELLKTQVSKAFQDFFQWKWSSFSLGRNNFGT